MELGSTPMIEATAAYAELLAAFPYPPYGIQQQLMINLYEALQNNQIGLFESPTGTGKTLSVICSVLKWLEDERKAQQEAEAVAQVSGQDSGLPDWMRSFSNNTNQPSKQAAQPTKAQKQPSHATGRASKQQQWQVLDEEGEDLSEFLLGSTAAAASPGCKRAAVDSGYISSSEEEDQIAADTGPNAGVQEGAAAAQSEAPKRPQIIFCSRTHSQLSQFVGELHRTRYAESTLLVAVGSRRSLCVNDAVLRLQQLSQINDRCLELQRNKAASHSNSSGGRKAAALNPTGNAGSTASGGGGGASDGSVHAAGDCGSQGVVGFMQQPRRQRSSGGSKLKKGKQAGCPFLAVEGGAAGWEDFTDLLLAAPIDVEELASLGREKKVCPYYGSRRAVPRADVILAPYSAVLLPDARSSLGIQLEGSVVVFDEAHNLLDAINGAHSTAVTAWQLMSVQRSLTAYYERFKAFFNPFNAQNVQLLLRIAAALHSCLAPPGKPQQQQQQEGTSRAAPHGSAAAATGRVVAVNDLLFDLGLDNVNMFELARWVKDNKIAFKVSGYTAVAVARAGGKVELQPTQQAAAAATTAGQDTDAASSPLQQRQQQQQLGHLSAQDGMSAIHSFMSFLLSLTNLDEDGRVIIEPTAAAAAAGGELKAGSDAAGVAAVTTGGRGSRLRYILLNAARHFGRLLSDARSVLLVSGTLAPVDGLRAQLFPDVDAHRLRHFECGHVVPASQLLALSVGTGPSGKALNLRHDSRGDQALTDELGQLLLNLAAVVPEGLVVFVPSFGYMEQLLARWQTSGLLGRLQQRKQVFREPRSATEVEQVLAAYSACMSQPAAQQPAASAAAAGQAQGSRSSQVSSASDGAVMLCVVGGKLSEGINFGDGLGRCVVMLGMPYPNPSDPELKERMAYLDKQAAAATAATAAAGQTTEAAAKGHYLQQQQQLQGPADQQGTQSEPLVHHLQPSVPQRGVFQVVNAGPHMQPTPGSATSAARAPSTLQPQPTHPPAASVAVGGATSSKCRLGSSTTDGTEQQHQHQQSPLRMLTGRDYYDDLCFKAVNQCVGRVVRHKGDYAAVLLVDSRWVVSPADWAAAQHSTKSLTGGGSSSARQLPVQKLPGWVQRSYVPTSGQFGEAYKQLAQFFKRQHHV